MTADTDRVTRAAILSRVSDDRDGTSRSVAQQTTLGRQAISDNGWLLAERHVYEDNSISASRFSTRDRPAWQRLRRAVEAGQSQAESRHQARPRPSPADVHCRVRDMRQPADRLP